MRAKELQTSTLEKQDILQFEIHLAAATNKATITGKSLSEALIFASTNPQYDKRLFSSVHENSKLKPGGEHVVYKSCF